MPSQGRLNLVIGQSGGATAVINASLVGAFEMAERCGHFGEIYGMRHGVEGLLRGELIDLRRQRSDIWPRLLHTPAAALGSTHYKPKKHDIPQVLEVLCRHDIRAFLYIGGNGSAKTVHRLAQGAQEQQYELCAVSVPKTIDNDLPYTDHCPGYGSAARFMALTAMHSTMNMLSVPVPFPLKVIETAGRNTGWLAAASALGKRCDDDPPHLILFPELPFRREQFLAQVELLYQRIGHVVIVAGEGLCDEKGQPLGSTDDDKTRSAAQYLGKLIKSELHMDTRFDRPGDLQWSDISDVDRDEAYLVGRAGVHALINGQHDVMVTLIREPTTRYRCTTGLVELEQVVGQQRHLPDEYRDAHQTMITPAFATYALPLLGDPLPDYPELA